MIPQCSWIKKIRSEGNYKVRSTYVFQSTPLKSEPHDSIFSLNQLSTLDQKSSPWAMRPLPGVLLRFLAGVSSSVPSSFSEASSSSAPRMVLFSHANRRYRDNPYVNRMQIEEVENVPISRCE